MSNRIGQLPFNSSDVTHSRRRRRCDMWCLRAAHHRSGPILWRSLARLCRTLRLERHLPEFRPDAACSFSVLAVKFVGYPKQSAVDDGTIIPGEAHDAGLDHEPAKFDQMPRAPAALDLPASHVMPRPRRSMPVVCRPVAFERRRRRAQMPVQIAATAPERTQRHASPMPPSLWHP